MTDKGGWRQAQAVLREIHRLLRPGGLLLLELHLIRSGFRPLQPLLAKLDPPHPYHFTHGQAVNLAKTAGFSVEFENLFQKGFRRFPLRELVSYNGVRHLGSSLVTGSVGNWRFVQD